MEAKATSETIQSSLLSELGSPEEFEIADSIIGVMLHDPHLTLSYRAKTQEISETQFITLSQDQAQAIAEEMLTLFTKQAISSVASEMPVFLLGSALSLLAQAFLDDVTTAKQPNLEPE